MEQRATGERLDELLQVLSHVQRRKLLVALLDHNPQDDSPAVLKESEDDRQTLDRLVEMEHVHLPKLADHGFIEWDREHNEVSKGPAFDDIRPLLELLVEHESELPNDWI